MKTLLLKSLKDWSSPDPNSISLVKGETYMSSKARLNDSEQNGGWLLVEDVNGKSGFVPLKMLKIKCLMNMNPQSQPVIDISNPTSNVILPIAEQVPLPQSISPIIDVHNNPIDLPHPFLDCDKSKNDI